MAERCIPQPKVTRRWPMPPCLPSHRCCTSIALRAKWSSSRLHPRPLARRTVRRFAGFKKKLRLADDPASSELPHQRAANCLSLEADVVDIARGDSEILVAIIGIQIFDTADQIFRKRLIDAATDGPTRQQLFILDRSAVFPELELRQRKPARGIDQSGRHHGNANPATIITAQVHII